MKNNLLTIGLLSIACAPDQAPESSWFDEWTADVIDDIPHVEGAHRVSLAHPQGMMTFDALDDDGTPLSVIDGVAMYDNGAFQLQFTDGESLYHLDAQTLRMTEVTPWRDPEGKAVDVLGLHRVLFNGDSILIARQDTQIRIFDPVSQTLSVPVELITQNPANGAIERFSPKTVTYVPSFNFTFGLPYLAMGENGGLYWGGETVIGGNVYISFTLIRGGIQQCDQSNTVEIDHLIAPRLDDPNALWTETITAVSDDTIWELTADVCLFPTGRLQDDNEDAIVPFGAFDVDLEQDGVDTIVWVHE